MSKGNPSPVVAFQGEHGAYSEVAAHQLFGSHIATLPCRQFSDIFSAVQAERADYGLVPVENSEAGTVSGSYALLLASPLFVVGEVELRVRHCLMAPRGQTLSDIRRAHSHPQALMQCEAFLRQHGIEPVAEYDTAGSAKQLAEKPVPHEAAIASALAAERYGLSLLAEGIETNPNNFTRFLAVGRTHAARAEASKTSIVFGTANQPGALYRALGCFASRGLNVTKLESSPSRRVPWEYFFYVDFEGHQDDVQSSAALEELRQSAAFLRVLGSYPAATTPRDSATPSAAAT